MRAIVTGHSTGLGAAIAEQLLERGYAVLGLSRRTHTSLADHFPDMLTECQLDLADTAAIGALVDGAIWRSFTDTNARILLINNAGVLQPIDPAGQQGIARIARAVAVNVAAPLILTDAFIAATENTGDRRVLHVSSGAARSAYAGWSIYCASKAALDHHARSVNEDRRPHLHIASVAPGVIDTAMQDQIREVDAARFPSVDRFRELKSGGHLQRPQDSARRLVDYLVGDAFGRDATVDIRELG